jgi:hypothetical protein
MRVPVSSTTGGVVALVLGSSLISSMVALIVNGSVGYLRGRRTKAYSALRLAVSLEEFAGQCAELIEKLLHERAAMGWPQQSAPDPRFRRRCGLARIRSQDSGPRALPREPGATVGPQPCLFRLQLGTETAEAECRDLAVELGHEAWSTAVALRRNHRLGPAVERLPWKFPQFLQREADALRQRRADYEARRIAQPVQKL